MQPLMTVVSNHGRYFQLKFFNRLGIKSVTIIDQMKVKYMYLMDIVITQF